MPNPGGIFRGCNTCRRRKIKCDQSLPECQKCLRYGERCPGYPTETDARFRHQTERIIQKAKLSNQEILVGHFFDQVLMPVGWYTHLPQLYQRSPNNGPLRLTIHAASMFLGANQSHNDQLLRAARAVYSLGLYALNAAISHPRRQLQDETLCAILVLNVLDDINGKKSFTSGTHLHGCRQLLELRKQKGVITPYTPDLTHSVVIQAQALVAQTDHSDIEHFATWLCNQSPEAPAAAIYDFCYRSGQFVRTATLFCSWACETRTYEGLVSIIRAGQELDASTAGWLQHGSAKWTHGRKESGSSINGDQRTDYYADVQVAKVWNHYRCARIMLHEAILSTIQHMDGFVTIKSNEELSMTRTQSYAIVKLLLSEVCNSIPFHLQMVDSRGLPCSPRSSRLLGGCALQWPLEVIRQCQWADSEHRRHVIKASDEINNVIGVRGEGLADED